MKTKRILSVMIVVFMVTLVSSRLASAKESNYLLEVNKEISADGNPTVINAYEAPTLPGGPHPVWEFNITGIGFSDPITLNLSYLLDEVVAENLKAYEEEVVYKDNNQTIIGFDILDLIQGYADVWYAGELAFTAEDDYSKSLNTTDILYSYYPPALEAANIKIIMAFAINGSYLPDSDWADKGALRLCVPSNSQVTYFNNMWVGNVTEISVTERWSCNVFINDQFETAITIDDPGTFTDYDYLSYNLTYHSESTKFEGPSILSIFDYLNVEYNDIALFKVAAPDFIATIDKSELLSEKPAILAMEINDEYLGFNGGPYRLVGGVLNSWNWLKNCMAIYITTNSTAPTNTSPGFTWILTSLALLSVPMIAVLFRKRN